MKSYRTTRCVQVNHHQIIDFGLTLFPQFDFVDVREFEDKGFGMRMK